MLEIIDLKPHFAALERYTDIADRLTEEENRKLVDYVRECHHLSYRAISERYAHWDEADAAHDVYVDPDATHFREKAVIPDTRAIADTVITYMMAALGGRNPMFQLEGQDRRSRKAALLLERVLHQSMRRTAGEARLAQHLLDIVRYGFAPTKIVWDAAQNQNAVVNFDPRKTFPDPRVNWGDWQDGQFIVFSDAVPFSSIHRSNRYPKVMADPEKYARITKPGRGWSGHAVLRQRGRGFRPDVTHTTWKLGQNRVIDEMWFTLAGYEVGIPTINTVWLTATVLDESDVISFRLNPYGTLFPTVIGGLYHDAHKTWSQSLYDLLLPLHDIATWLLRSRVDNVQAALNNLIFADPTMVNIPDLIDRNPWGVVRTLPGVKPGDGIHIADVKDVTRGHWTDIAALNDLKQRVSAASDAQQGMPTADVRTATEIQRLTQLGSQRLGVLSRVVSATSIRPMVRMMVSNLQDALSMNGSLRTDRNVPPDLQGMAHEGYIDYGIADLQGQIEYLVIDGTLPLEPSRDASTWLNMLQVLNQTGLLMEFDMPRIAEEAIKAMGISDVDQYRLGEQQGLSPSQEVALMDRAQVQPNEQVQREVERGNLVPMRQNPQQIAAGRASKGQRK